MRRSKALSTLRSAVALMLLALASTVRAQDDEVGRLVRLLGLRPGAVVAEVGAGDGEFAAAVAGAVGPGGRVLATELDSQKLERIRESAAKAGRTNVVAIQAGVSETGLPDGCCDAIFMRDVYHHLTDPMAIDAALYRALRRGGPLLIVDFPPTWYLSPWTPDGVSASRKGHGIRATDARAELVAVGFEPVQTIDTWRLRWLGADVYALLVRRPPGPPQTRAP